MCSLVATLLPRIQLHSSQCIRNPPALKGSSLVLIENVIPNHLSRKESHLSQTFKSLWNNQRMLNTTFCCRSWHSGVISFTRRYFLKLRIMLHIPSIPQGTQQCLSHLGGTRFRVTLIIRFMIFILSLLCLGHSLLGHSFKVSSDCDSSKTSVRSMY